MKPWIGVDLDGTLAHYDEWRGIEHIGAPIPAMIDRVQRWIREGLTIRIFTARVTGQPASGGPVREIIRKWLAENGLPDLEVTNVKDFGMLELWDDRAVQVGLNTGQPLGVSTRGLT